MAGYRDGMDLRSLRYFLAVVEHGGVTKGAAALYISQPSLSQTIRRLEAEAGVRLLDRSGPAAVPTTAGLEMAEVARRVLAELDNARERVHRVTNLSVGRLVVTTASTLSVYPLTPIVAALRRRHPGLEVHVRNAGTGPSVLDSIQRNTAEIGVLDLPLEDPRWAVRPLPREEVVLVTAAHGRDGESVARESLGAFDLGVATVDLDASSELGALLAATASRARVRTAHRQLLWEVVAAGVVSTVMGRRSAGQVLRGAAVRPLEPPLWRTPGLVWRPGALSPAGEALLAAAADVFDRGVDE